MHRTMDEIPSARMAYAPGLSWVCALVVAGVVLTWGLLAFQAGGLGPVEFGVSAVIAVLFATWGALLWRRWSRRRAPRLKRS